MELEGHAAAVRAELEGGTVFGRNICCGYAGHKPAWVMITNAVLTVHKKEACLFSPAPDVEARVIARTTRLILNKYLEL